MTDLFVKINTHKKQNLPFVLYSKPFSCKTIGLFQTNDHLYSLTDYNSEGFVFTTFDNEQSYLFPSNFLEVYIEQNNADEIEILNTKNLDKDISDKTFFEDLVNKAKAEIQKGHCDKIVVSRKEIFHFQQFNIEISFKKMLKLYKSAFKYCVFHPKLGLWMGATPEQLIKVQENKMQTVALAGTRLTSNEKEWGNKEQKEQKFVTDFILESIKKEVVEENVSSAYTVNAGNIQHIKTDIEATFKNEFSFEKVLKSLHPTPAVCGNPKLLAKEFILKNENYSRGFYAGYLGELNRCFETDKLKMTDLFVNLRCMQIKNEFAEIYVGCGITKESNSELEYVETKNKSVTMKNILN